MEQLLSRGFEISSSDMGVLYAVEDRDSVRPAVCKSVYDCSPPAAGGTEWFRFIRDCGETIVLNSRSGPYFGALFFHPKMRSALAVPVFSAKVLTGIFCYNSLRENHYGSTILETLEDFVESCSCLFTEKKKVNDYVLASVP